MSMRKLLLFGLASFFAFGVSAQDDIQVRKLQAELSRTVKKEVVDTVPKAWRRGGIVNINGTQGSLKNWAAGGDKFSLALNSYFNYFAFYKKGKVSWDNALDFNFGYIQSSSIGSRKNDDRLDILSKYGHNFSGDWFLSGLFNFRSQLFDGYTYSDSDRTFSSTFLSPAYALTSIGFDYKPSPNFSVFISPITSRYIIVASKQLADKGLYGLKPGEHFHNELGAFSSINWMKRIGTNVSYKGRLDLFSDYKTRPENVDLFMTNYFSFKISKYFTASYNLDLIYDDDVRLFGEDGKSPGLQLKSLIGLGFQMKLN